jgi:hypothetical protein
MLAYIWLLGLNISRRLFTCDSKKVAQDLHWFLHSFPEAVNRNALFHWKLSASIWDLPMMQQSTAPARSTTNRNVENFQRLVDQHTVPRMRWQFFWKLLGWLSFTLSRDFSTIFSILTAAKTADFYWAELSRLWKCKIIQIFSVFFSLIFSVFPRIFNVTRFHVLILKKTERFL